VKVIRKVVEALRHSERQLREVGVELSSVQMRAVSGGLPRGGWGAPTSIDPEAQKLELPRGGW
jgi:hypothetical protein